MFKAAPAFCFTSGQNLVVPLDPQPDENELIVNLTLRSGINVPGRVLSPSGQLLGNYLIYGVSTGSPWKQTTDEGFAVSGYFPTQTRRLIVYHAGQNLAGVYDLTGEPPERLEMTLRPAATLVGRALDAGGAPLEHAEIDCELPQSRFRDGTLAAGDREYGVLQRSTTDVQGRFELKGLVPGLKYTAHLNFFQLKVGEKRLKSSRQGPIFTDVTARSRSGDRRTSAI